MPLTHEKSSEKLIDISPLISENTAVFPGDQSYERKVNMDYVRGNHMGLSQITTTLHIGAHADSPWHYHSEGEGIDQRSLHYYFGPCQVIDVSKEQTEKIYPIHIQNKTIQATRVLFKTQTFINPNQWSNHFTALSSELINELAQQKVILVGIDTPSIDPAKEKVLSAHHAIYKNNMAILEGLMLEHVNEGFYHLIALPLKLKDADASPVRAVLWKN